jgi:exonuclease III
MRVLSWNTGGRVRRANQQLAAIRERRPDVVCLQEVRRSTVDVLKEGLSAGGLIHTLDSLLSGDDAAYESPSRQTGTLIASRWPLHALPGPDIPWSEKALATLVESPAAKIEVHTAHVPNGSSNGWVKIDTFNRIYKRLASNSGVARILCGDFNSPQLETRGGRVITWGEHEVDGQFVCWGRYRGRTGEEWAMGERSVLQGLAEFDLHDVFRGLHGFGVQAFSWYLRRQGKTIGRRFDHVFASRRFSVRGCDYLHALRKAKLSDHSPIEADLDGPR